MSWRRTCRATVVAVLLAGSAYAVEPAHQADPAHDVHDGAVHGAHDDHHAAIPWSTLAFSAINLGIFLMILRRLALPPIRSWVAERRELVVRELEEATAIRGEAERMKAEWQRRLANLDDEIELMRAQAKQDIERERERILAAAHAAAAALQRDAQRLAAAEGKQLEAQLRAEAARKAVGIAEERIRREWNDADQRRLVSEFLTQVRS
ncbi:MAG TPA: ATP synthase F0 subunit B [Terriglobales bacterium]|nr:ATP synthase F0 subunit B [Terriglobales bacterium]